MIVFLVKKYLTQNTIQNCMPLKFRNFMTHVMRLQNLIRMKIHGQACSEFEVTFDTYTARGRPSSDHAPFARFTIDILQQWRQSLFVERQVLKIYNNIQQDCHPKQTP